MSQLRVTTLNNASNTGTANLTLDDAGNATVGNTLVMGSSFKRNRIINGDMRVDQRATAVSSSGYSVDRWTFAKSNDATESVAQNTDAPVGFSYSLRDTISVADTSIGATQVSGFIQPIEGYNIADLGFGTANAKTVTLSFWVKATQTGTYSALLQGGTPTRQVFKAFSVNASNTWEYKNLTFVGDTNTGTTWNSTNGLGLSVIIYAALGSAYINGTDGTWAASTTNNYGPSGMANALSANGNIFAITGVQLEVGSVATPYERQIYSDQLAQCQRYCYRYSADGSINDYAPFGVGRYVATNQAQLYIKFPITMRYPPGTLTQIGTVFVNDTGLGGSTYTSATLNETAYDGATVLGNATTGVTAGTATTFYASGASNAALIFSAEL